MPSEPTARVVIVTRPIDAATFDRLDRDADIIALCGDSLEVAEPALFEPVLDRRSLLVVGLDRTSRSFPFALGMVADVFAVHVESSVTLNPRNPEILTGIGSRIGREAIRLLFDGPVSIDGRGLCDAGLCDALVEKSEDSVKWIDSWLGKRSVLALAAAGRLIRSRGGDVLERFEFGRLFAAGEPQRGLEKFLKKLPLDFTGKTIVERL
ncbi:MAG: hypothetical protein WBX15_01000 [Thermoanaerobaculia bacterium]